VIAALKTALISLVFHAQSPAMDHGPTCHGPPCHMMYSVPTDAADLDARAQSPAMSSFHASRRTSPAPSDSSVSRHVHTPVDPRPGSRSAGLHRGADRVPPDFLRERHTNLHRHHRHQDDSHANTWKRTSIHASSLSRGTLTCFIRLPGLVVTHSDMVEDFEDSRDFQDASPPGRGRPDGSVAV